ncbi:ABC-F family ATP-binding cassette domain-containing protein [Tsukamurella spumae]|uniref:ABC-F family ATP-binding cassette domain-containing protein n=1 Tax=Tsukamurella spumae TaxID=44753 RepID=A0A846WXH8_9ACTN|nr:ABC-F family ATP-binding cassette domain-containing protein [Tsukamurella spumae]NKY17086.1 ABC-F family ATP-binding cassette domain-containing protein [Tsukamurella spumae]
MTVLTTRDLSVAYADRTLFTGLDLVIAPGEVVGLVGANGAGKSTLLKLLAGVGAHGAPDVSGTVDLSPADASVGYLAQEHERRPGETVAHFVARRTGVAAALEAMDAAALALADDPEDDQYTPALDRWLALGGADLDQRLTSILDEVGLADADAEMTGLSGGQAARAGLAAVLASRYDVLLLDEPTNDLDLAGLELLERFVTETSSATAMVLVSHDREFLARTVTTVVELDLAQQQIGVYGGGYEAYLVERDVARRHAREEYDEYAGKLSGLQDRAQMQRNWMEHGVRNARRKMRSGDPDKAGRKARLESTEKQASKARQTERAIERLEVVEEPRKEWELRMSILAAPRSGTVVVTASGARVDYPGLTVGPVSVSVEYGDRILLTGPNGAGKSTLLGLLLGRIAPSTGTVALGSGVEVGEVDQARGRFLSDGPLLDTFCAEVPDTPPADVRTLLAKFGLRGHHVLRPAASLSPGERTRAALALLQARGVNLLVLDEPTNHLDLPAIEQLEQAVESFDGTVILVTHDRRMLDTVRATRRWRMDGGVFSED